MGKLDTILKQIEKDAGKGSIIRLGDKAVQSANIVKSGSVAIDKALGIGGYPRGRVIEIYGPESSGKTTLALHAIAECQKQGGICAYIDMEHAVDVTYARALNVNVNDLLFSQPDYGEQALDFTEALIESGEIDVIVIDSVAALVPKVELEGGMEDNQIGLQARMMGKALRKITGMINKTNTLVIFINQIREKTGGYGNPETTPGGRALRFYASVRIRVQKTQTENDCNHTKIKVMKNKVAVPFKEAEFDIEFGKGIVKEDGLITVAIADDVIQKSGAWLYYGDQKWQGRAQMVEALKADVKLFNEIESKLK